MCLSVWVLYVELPIAYELLCSPKTFVLAASSKKQEKTLALEANEVKKKLLVGLAGSKS